MNLAEGRGRLYLHATDVLRETMEELGISQTELARRLGVGDAAVSRVLGEARNLRLSTIADYGTALGVRFVFVAEKEE
jgi:transcriptional regulator with XRE-family HTH domain